MTLVLTSCTRTGPGGKADQEQNIFSGSNILDDEASSWVFAALENELDIGREGGSPLLASGWAEREYQCSRLGIP